MRTTLAIDDDLLMMVKGLAARQHKTLGEVFSALIRVALQPKKTKTAVRNGVRLLAVQPDATLVTSQLVNQLRDELP